MRALAAVLAIVVLVVAIFGGMYVSHRNQMVALNEQVKSSWSEVDVNLQRRADLIPNLVETVKGYAAQEQTVFGDIAKARSALLNAQTPQDKIAANGQLDGALGRLLAVVENYPQLKSNENFLRLQDELAGTENRIAVARKRYNDSLQTYNTSSASGPTARSRAGPASNATMPISKPPPPPAKRQRSRFQHQSKSRGAATRISNSRVTSRESRACHPEPGPAPVTLRACQEKWRERGEACLPRAGSAVRVLLRVHGLQRDSFQTSVVPEAGKEKRNIFPAGCISYIGPTV